MAKNFVKIVFAGDSTSLKRALNDLDRNATATGGRFKKLGPLVASGLGLAAGALGAFAVKAIKMAGDAEEVRSKLGVVFGKELPRLTENLDRFSRATGTSRFELREQAANMGALLRPMLDTQSAAANMSLSIVKLATDLGSFNNIPTADALEKIRAGLVGEAEPLRSLGVLLNEASVKQKAYQMGLADVGAELTEQQKVQARYALIMEQTKLAHGDAERTSGSFANQLKRLKANVSDTATELGIKLLPVANKVLLWANDHWPEFAAGFKTAAGIITKAVDAITAVFEVLIATIGGIVKAVEKVIGVGRDIKAFFESLSGGSKSTAKDTVSAFERISQGARNTAGTAKGAAADTSAALRGIVTATQSDMRNIAASFGNGIDSIIRTVRTKGAVIRQEGNTLGVNFIQGAVAGVNANSGALAVAFSNATGNAITAGRRRAKIQSPSKETEEDGKALMDGMSKGIKERASQTAAEMRAAVAEVIRSAKSNLTSIGSDLAGRLGSFIDSKAAKASTALDNSEDANRLRAIRAQQERENAVRERYRLEHAVATAADAQALAEAQQALSDWQLEQEASALSASLDAKRTKIAEEAEARKVAAERGLADLTDSLNRGLITQGEFVKGINAILRSSEHDYKESGALLGSAFARGFREQMRGIFKQGNAIATGPKRKGSGSAPEIVRPKAAKKSHTGSIVPGRRGAEVPMILLAGQRVLPPGQRSASGGGAVININVSSMDPQGAATAVASALREYVRRNGPIAGVAA